MADARWQTGLSHRDVTCNIPTMARDDVNTVRERVRSHRARLREQGLRPIQIWVPDVRSPKFATEALRQSLAIARSQHAADDQAFIDAFNAEVLQDDDA